MRTAGALEAAENVALLRFSEKYDKLKTPSTRAALRCCLQVQVVTLPARIADSSFLHRMKQSSGSGTFFGETSRSLEGEGRDVG